ncbi:uncharacterized protein LOC110700810 [Chenopodium quinoa]|uniref:uncharacterized protein LOC110700810 n=1 Tax=Chenopodium quinoa TaxID=63459 RepID=UPI000B781D7A|nr:uncharacterized protein LOC110700810 [Chenopodium quinoa]
MLVAWITNTLDSSVRATIGEYEDAQLLWTNLKNRFCVVSGTRICQLKLSLGECKQTASESIAAYFGRITKIFDELHTYITVPHCSCGACTCNIVAQVERLRQEDLIHHFLIGLDDAYASLRGQLLSQDPLPSVDKAYQQLVQAERLRGGSGDSAVARENPMAFKLQHEPASKPQRSSDNSEKFCNHCNRVGHDKTGCFQIHGYPSWWGNRGRGGRGRGRGDSGGSNSGGRGGGRGSGPAAPVRANKAATQSTVQPGGATTDDGAALAGVTPTQLQQLLDHLSSMKPKLHGPNDEEGDWSG